MKVEVKIDDKCEETTVTIVARAMSGEVSELASRLSGQRLQRLVGFREDAAVLVDSEKIVRVYAANQKVYIVTDEGEYVSRLRLYQFEEQLSPSEFVRISNSEIINLKKVKDLDLSFSGSICVRFLDGSATYVSRRYVGKIKNILGL